MGKGWNRASFDFNTRPDKMIRDVSQVDLIVPTVTRGRLHLLLVCLACGAMLSLLWVWTSLWMLSVLGLGLGRWFYPAVGAAALVAALALYVFSTWDFNRQETWGREA